MVFREVSVVEIREVLRSWLAGAGLRTVAGQAGVDRKTARRYVEAAVAAGLARDGGTGQLTDELVGQVAEAVRPVRPGGHGQPWDRLEACHPQIQAWVRQGLTVVKIGVLLERQGVAVPYRTLHRFCAERCGYGRAAVTTVRVADGEPGAECQLDFGYLGLLADPVSGRQRKVHALIFTACYSRHMFVWLSFTQTLAAFVAGCEAAWVFFGGVFKVLVLDYVPRDIIRVLCPAALCAAGRANRGGGPARGRGEGPGGAGLGHITRSFYERGCFLYLLAERKLPMLEDYFVKPQTIDRIRASWIGPEIERYVDWLSEHGYRARNVPRRVPVLVAFGEFARARGAGTVQDLPGHVEAFVAGRIARRARARRDGVVSPTMAKEVRGPVEQMLTVVLPGFEGTCRRCRKQPFAGVLPGFFEYLVAERGLRPAAVESYRHHLDRFETYLTRVGVEVSEVSPALLSAFVTERSAAGLAKTTVREGCGVLRVFLRYAHREGVLGRDLSGTVGWPQAYRLATIPRSITWSEVDRVLGYVDRRTPCGRRDYAILLLLVIYGLRGREVAALRLDDIDWKRERLAVPERKAGHSTAYPLSPPVGDAIVDYLRHGRPATTDRHLFIRSLAPIRPLGAAAVSACARRYLLLAGVDVPRPGSHTLRHTCVQRLVDAEFSLKEIGDFVGHRSPASTEIYAKVAIESLRQVSLGDGEEVLR
jgi:site-specific recombinase XerD/transposase